MRGFLWVIAVLLPVFRALGQETEKVTAYERDSIRYTRLKERFYRNRITKEIYKVFFNDIYNRKNAHEVRAIETNPFLDHEGALIGSITVQQLNVLGASVYDTTRRSNRFQHFVSEKLHINTREQIIRKSLLMFREGDRVDPVLLKENERVLRQSPVILDARILVTPREDEAEVVDVLVLVQDVWPVIPGGSFAGFNNFGIKVSNNNVRGITHANTVALRWRGGDTLQPLGFRVIYTIPYLGNTFISAQAGFIWERDLKQQYVRVSKPFLTVDTRYAGALEVGLTERQEYKMQEPERKVVFTYPVRYRYYDMWFGRAFKIGKADQMQSSRLVTTVRLNNYDYTKRPEVSIDTNKIYWSQKALLFSIGYSDRNYKRDLLIYGFGRTEDVPIGSMLTFTAGRDNTEFGSRGYAGARYSKGGYLPKNLGYVYGLIDAGSYLQSRRLYQSVVSGTLNYFTPLMNFRLSQIRQFVNVRYTRGFRRDALEYINVTDEFGIRGISSNRLIGTRRLNIGTETVLFAPGSFLGFRAAHFLYADFGWIETDRRLWKSPVYQSYGLGVRLRNEHLTFNTIEFRIGYYHNIPALSSPWRFRLLGVTSLRLPDFDISAPEIVPFR